MNIKLPNDVKNMIDVLVQNGFEAYAVGGCIRDTLLGRTPQDWDITTSARPEQVKALFLHTVDTGIAHGTVTVLIGRSAYEVTTYRIDGEYEDARHPKEVTYTSDLVEDLKRRDFTVNAMAYNDEAGLVDVFCGADDLKAGVIRCVGSPKERFGEDALRMLRAVRFAAQLGFAVERETAAAVSEYADSISRVSAERIQMEISKLLVSPYPEKLRLAYELGLTKVFLPEFDRMMETPQHSRHHCYSVGEHTLHALMEVPPKRILRLAMLFHDVAKPLCVSVDKEGKEHYHGHPQIGAELTKTILRRLKFDNNTIREVCRLILWHDDRPEISEKSIRRAISRIGVDAYPALFEVKRADMLAQSDYKRAEKLKYLEEYQNLYEAIRTARQCIQKKDLAVNGNDLIAIGMKPGKEVGIVLDQLFEAVLEEPEWNRREKLLELAHKLIIPFI